jgi:hypothetical protein
VEKIFNRGLLRTVGLDQGHAKHPVVLERVLEHLPVARLKNIERQKRVREKYPARERHDRDFAWKSD